MARVVCSGILLLLLCGCHGGSGLKWGESATLTPGWSRVGQATVRAAVSPFTWVPAVGAGAMRIGNWDRDVSRWASDRAPVFGSRKGADRAGDYLVILGTGLYGGTAMALPGGDDPATWTTNKGTGGLVGLAALAGTTGVTVGLKTSMDRTRPDHSDSQSFPSGHAAIAAALATLSSDALGYSSLSPGQQAATEAGLWTVAAGTAWSRIEAGEHYPSDVLAGMAIGHFITAAVTESFLGAAPSGVAMGVEPRRGGWGVSVAWTFP